MFIDRLLEAEIDRIDREAEIARLTARLGNNQRKAGENRAAAIALAEANIAEVMRRWRNYLGLLDRIRVRLDEQRLSDTGPLYQIIGPMEVVHMSGAPRLDAWAVLRYVLLLVVAVVGTLVVALGRRGHRPRDGQGAAT